MDVNAHSMYESHAISMRIDNFTLKGIPSIAARHTSLICDNIILDAGHIPYDIAKKKIFC